MTPNGLTTIATVGDMLRNGYGLTISCNNVACRHSSKLDLAALAERIGPDVRAVGADTPFRRALICSQCGGRKAQMSIQPPTRRGN